MTPKIHHLSDGRLKVGEYYITDIVAIGVIKELMALEQVWFTNESNWPIEAVQAIKDVLVVGSKKHPPASWRNQNVYHHTDKASDHLADFMDGTDINSDGEDTLAHALTRLAMAVSVREDK